MRDGASCGELGGRGATASSPTRGFAIGASREGSARVDREAAGGGRFSMRAIWGITGGFGFEGLFTTGAGFGGTTRTSARGGGGGAGFDTTRSTGFGFTTTTGSGIGSGTASGATGGVSRNTTSIGEKSE